MPSDSNIYLAIKTSKYIEEIIIFINLNLYTYYIKQFQFNTLKYEGKKECKVLT